MFALIMSWIIVPTWNNHFAINYSNFGITISNNFETVE